MAEMNPNDHTFISFAFPILWKSFPRVKKFLQLAHTLVTTAITGRYVLSVGEKGSNLEGEQVTRTTF